MDITVLGLNKKVTALIFILFCYHLSGQVIHQPDVHLKNEDAYLSLQFDNDTYYYTDYYYTNGLELRLKLKAFSKAPWNGIYPKVKNGDGLESEIIVGQRLYTPKNIRDTTIQFNDRPFSATLEIDQNTLSINEETGLSFLTTLRLGIMGPAAGGESLQRLIHDWIQSPDAKGWDYQIKNGIIINYDLLMSYPVVYSNKVNFSLIGNARVGTLIDDIGAGISFDLGSYSKKEKSRLKYVVSMFAITRLVGYNALLQGGLFTKQDPYVLTYSQITPVVFSANFMIGVSWYGVSLSFTHNFLTKEFDAGSVHNYASIRLAYSF